MSVDAFSSKTNCGLRWLRRGTLICPTVLSTGADDGRVVMNLTKTFQIQLYLASIFSSSVTQVVDTFPVRLSTALIAASVDGIVP